VLIKFGKKPLTNKILQGDIIESPQYIMENKLKVDYKYYSNGFENLPNAWSDNVADWLCFQPADKTDYGFVQRSAFPA